jgi:hypothetical protein
VESVGACVADGVVGIECILAPESEQFFENYPVTLTFSLIFFFFFYSYVSQNNVFLTLCT